MYFKGFQVISNFFPQNLTFFLSIYKIIDYKNYVNMCILYVIIRYCLIYIYIHKNICGVYGMHASIPGQTFSDETRGEVLICISMKIIKSGGGGREVTEMSATIRFFFDA